MIITPVVVGPKGEAVNSSVIDELKTKGCAVPDVERTIYNRGEKKNPDGTKRPVLTTVVYFVDGTKVSVTNSLNDSVVDADGKVTREAKERGYLYAWAKRMMASKYAVCEETGDLYLKTEGFGRILNEQVDAAYDQQEEEAKRKTEAAKAKAEFEATKGTSKRKRAALGDVVVDLSESVKDMKECIAQLKADLADMKAAR